MPTPQEIDKVKSNLKNLIDLNSDLLVGGNYKIENAYALLTLNDDHDLGLQIGVNLMSGAFWVGSDYYGAILANFACGVISHYTSNTPPSLQGTTSNLLNRFLNTSNQFLLDLETFYENPEAYWDVVYSGNVINAFGTYSVSGKLSDLATIDVPDKTSVLYSQSLVKCEFGLDQQIWNELLKNFVITGYYPEYSYSAKNYSWNDMCNNASTYYLKYPAYWNYWYYQQNKGLFGGDHSCYVQTDYNIGIGYSFAHDGSLSNQACNYLFNDLFDGVPNPNMTQNAGLFPREFVFNNMPGIRKVSQFLGQENPNTLINRLKKLFKQFIWFK